MTEEIAKLQVRLEATHDKLRREVDRASRKLNAGATKMERRAGKLDKRLSDVGGRFGVNIPARGAAIATALAAVGLAIRQISREGEKIRELEGRFNALTGSAERSAKLMRGVFDVVKATGGTIDGTAAAITRFRIAADALGATDDQVVQFTENFEKLGVIGGATAEDISRSALQLSQGLAAGVLRAEEFNSVIDATPLVVTTLADGLGVSVGELRKMVVEGRVLSQDVFRVLLEQTDDINEKFKEVPDTVSRAMGRLKGELSETAALIDENVGLSRTWASVINGIANALDSIQRRQMVGSVTDLRRGLKMVQDRIAADAAAGREIHPFLREQEQKLSQQLSAASRQAENAGIVDFGTPESGGGGVAAKPVAGTSPSRAGRAGQSPQERAAEQFRDLAKAIAEQTDEADFLLSIMGKEGAERERLIALKEQDKRLYEILSLAAQAQNEITDQEVEKLKELNGWLTESITLRAQQEEALRKQADAAQEAARSTERLFDSLGNALIQARSFDDVLKNLAITLSQEVLRGALLGQGVFASGGLENLFSGFATGGRPKVGVPSVVGEKGKEIFVPDAPGRVLSHTDAMAAVRGGGGGAPSVVQHINLSPGVDATTIAMIESRVLPQAAQIAVTAVADARGRGGALARAL